MIAASNPIPAMTRKMCSSGTACWPLGSTDIRPTSIRTFWPVSATTRAFSTESIGSSRFLAQRLPVPAGRGARRGSGPTGPAGTAPQRSAPPKRADDPRSLLHRLPCLPGTWVRDRRLVPERLTPALRLACGGEAPPGRRDGGELRRVDDDPGPLEWRRFLLGPLRAELVAVRSSAPAGDPGDLHDGVPSRDDDGDDDDEGDDRDDDPERRAVEHSQTLSGDDARCPGSRFDR